MENQQAPSIDAAYQALVRSIFSHGFTYKDSSRDIYRLQIPSYQLQWRASEGRELPLLMLKRIPYKSVVVELLWFLKGRSDLAYLHEHGVHIWDKDVAAARMGDDAGRIYGRQWRDFDGRVDQIDRLVEGMRKYPHGTRHLVSAWHPGDIEGMALPPCHWAFECLVDGDEHFLLKWHQRSVDVFLGLPFNIASYGTLGYILEELTGLKFDGLIGDLSNVHIYQNHIMQCHEMLRRDVAGKVSPRLHVDMQPGWVDARTLIDEITPEHLVLSGYEPLGRLPAEMLAPIRKE